MRRQWWWVLLVVVLWAQPVWGTIEISPSFLGMYRKTMRIERDLRTYAARYQLNPRLARAVVLQESGGNAQLISSAGARGYFQVMPGTFRLLRVRSNIEAGIKYLAQLSRQFGRDDYAIAAYNAGPGTIARNRPLRLETLQYVINVGHYKSVLHLYEPEVRRQAKDVKLWTVRQGESWTTIAQQTEVPAPFLYLYNPFLAARPLQAGAVVAYPTAVPATLLEWEGEELYYTSRLGDSYLNLALVFGVDLERFRRQNDLWRLQQLPVDMRLRVGVPADSPFRHLQPVLAPPAPPTRTYTVRRGDTLERIARHHGTTVAALKRSNGLTTTRIVAGARLTLPGTERPAAPSLSGPEPRVYTVRRGDTLHQIARRYRITLHALRQANDLRGSHLQTGQTLVLPGE